MKKIIALTLTLLLVMTLCACGGKEAEKTETAETVAVTQQPEQEQKEQLTEEEVLLVEYLINIVTEDFVDPSAACVLKVCDYQDRDWHEEDHPMYGPNTVVVCMQGENRMGGGGQAYLKICLTTAENTSDAAQDIIDARRVTGDFEGIMDYKGEAGEYVFLDEYYEPKNDSSDKFDIGRINTALEEYWEGKGF